MSNPEPQSNLDPPKGTTRRLQFRLRQAFVTMTGVALGCGLVAWLGSASVIFLFVATGPAVTGLVLNRTDGECPVHAVALGAAAQALMIVGALFVLEVLPAIYSNCSPRMLLERLIAPVNFGLVGGLLSVLISLPFLVLWYAVRNNRQTAPQRDENPASERPEPDS